MENGVHQSCNLIKILIYFVCLHWDGVVVILDERFLNICHTSSVHLADMFCHALQGMYTEYE